MSSLQHNRKSTPKCKCKIWTTMYLPSTTMNLRSKRAVLKKVPSEFQINCLKLDTRICAMIQSFLEAMKSKCNSRLCRSCKCTNNISKWTSIMNRDIAISVLVQVLEAIVAVIMISKDALREMLQEDVPRFNKTPILFSKRIKVVQVRSLGKTCPINLREVLSD